MRLDRAIEIQTIHNDHNPNITDAEREAAHQLSIEAMKREQILRREIPYDRDGLLPGETEED